MFEPNFTVMHPQVVERLGLDQSGESTESALVLSFKQTWLIVVLMLHFT